MTKDLIFIRLSNRWFVDIPWEGSVDDLEMVSGADTFLDVVSEGKREVCIEVTTDETDDVDTIVLKKTHEDEFGGTYKINTYDYKGEIWLCNVTKHIFDEFPERFYIKVK